MATPTSLPAEFVSGAILTAAQQNDLRGAFRVLQVVAGQHSTQVNHNSTSYTTSNVKATITPSATTNKILVFAHMNGTVKGAENAGNGLFLEIRRGGTPIHEVKNLHETGTALLSIGTCTMLVLDSPATTSATTYEVFGKNAVAAATVATQLNNVTSRIILAEISA
jgi:hypothetical protein